MMNAGREGNLASITRRDLSSGKRRAVAFFCMLETGHFQRLRPLISGLARGGIATHIFTHCKFRPQVEQAGGIFFDLFSKYPMEQADDESIPVPCRYVTFVARYAEQIRRDVEEIGPSLIIHDTFALIGRIIAELLDIPWVNVCAGHNATPERILAVLREDPRVKVSPRCLQAVEVLRESYGLADASPFSYVSSISPHLNIYCEPQEFLDEEERRVFEPVAFYGSLLSPEEEPFDRQGRRAQFDSGSVGKVHVYVSFGTIVWRYYAADALRALRTLAEAFSEFDKVRAVISLGGVRIGDDALTALARPNVSVEEYVDQWRILQGADAFVTHQGMNSTHEAIFHRVPMISYPFFWDQPALAAKCRKLGLAIPLSESPRGEFGKDHVRAALARLADEADSMKAALSRAREWELAVMEKRPSVHRRIGDLMEGRG
jgi:MGT family glycosyltransferase